MPRLAPRRLATRAFVALAAVTLAGNALADVTKSQCVEADTVAQNERRAEHFRAAREQLQTCSAAACPKLVREDCTQRLNDLDTVTPTVVFAVKDAKGDDVISVRVSMDGQPLATELSGVGLLVDPGIHVFKFEAEGATAVEKKLVVREGERNRQERVTLLDLNAPAGGAVVVAPPPKPPEESRGSWGRQKTAAVVVGGVGLVGVIVGGVMGAMSFSSWSSSKSECGAGGCPSHSEAVSDHDSAVTDATVSDIGFIAGGVLAAGGIVLFVAAPSGASSSSSTAGTPIRLVPRLHRGGGGAMLEGRF